MCVSPESVRFVFKRLYNNIYRARRPCIGRVFYDCPSVHTVSGKKNCIIHTAHIIGWTEVPGSSSITPYRLIWRWRPQLPAKPIGRKKKNGGYPQRDGTSRFPSNLYIYIIYYICCRIVYGVYCIDILIYAGRVTERRSDRKNTINKTSPKGCIARRWSASE